jgi:hypothetical protein
VQQNPLTIAKASETLTITPAARPQFAQLAQSVKAQLDAAETVAGSAMYAE